MGGQRVRDLNSARGSDWSVAQTAGFLSISEATVRNWIKLGLIRSYHRMGGKLLIDSEEIMKLRERIESGALNKLTSRRNKSAAQGEVRPVGYTSSPDYNRAASQIVEWVDNEGAGSSSLGAVAAEAALRLFAAKGLLRPVQPGSSMLRKLLRGSGAGSMLKPIVRELLETADGGAEPNWRLLEGVGRMMEHVRYSEGEDLLGLLYMSLTRIAERKGAGAYYTPGAAADVLLEEGMRTLRITPQLRAADLSCGSGGLLIRAYLLMKRELVKSGRSALEADQLLRGGMLVGYDIDRAAAALAKLNVLLLAEELPRRAKLPIYCRDTLIEPLEHDRYDFIFGNPPWGGSISRQQLSALREPYLCADGYVDSFGLFVERALRVLPSGGVLSYLLPESVLQARAHGKVRKLLEASSDSLRVLSLGQAFKGVFAGCIALTARLGRASGVKLSPATIYRAGTDGEAEARLADQLRDRTDLLRLKGHAEFGLGLVTGNNLEHVSSVREAGFEPVLKGGDVFRYRLEAPRQYVRYDRTRLQQAAPDSFYRAPEKLVYRFINEQLVFAYDGGGRLTLNSVNAVIPKLPGYSAKYVLAILNSRAAQFFHTVSFASVKVLRKHLEAVPLPAASLEDRNRLEALVELMLSDDAGKWGTKVEIYEQIDDEVMKLYQIDREDRLIIRRRVGSIPKYV